MLRAAVKDCGQYYTIRSKIVEFPGILGQIHNPDFNYGEFAIIKSQTGLNSYKISVKEWVEKTNAIGIRAKAGTYAKSKCHAYQ